MKSYNEKHYNIWSLFDANAASFIIINVNGFVKKNGELVMGAGIAREAADKYPGIAYALGQKVMVVGNVPLINKEKRLITLPTKEHWTEPADRHLIELGLTEIVQMADKLKISSLYLGRPGCGHGKLNWVLDVKPLCDQYLDSRFTVCSK